jgi:hypothetical protein
MKILTIRFDKNNKMNEETSGILEYLSSDDMCYTAHIEVILYGFCSAPGHFLDLEAY